MKKPLTKKQLESVLSTIAKVEVEITMRGEKEFTYSFEGVNEDATSRILRYLKGYGTFTVSNAEEEGDITCIYQKI